MDKRIRYAKPEYERRFLLTSPPSGLLSPLRIRDRYLTGTRLRLRQIETMEGDTTELKLGHKWRPEPGDPGVVMHTSIYLDVAEHALLAHLPGNELVKTRHRVDGQPNWAVDVHESPSSGVVILEVNFQDREDASAFVPPPWVAREVTREEAYTGGALAALRN